MLLSLRAMSRSMVLLQLGSMLSSENMWKPMTHAPTGCKEHFWSDIDHCRSTVERDGPERLLLQTLTLPINTPPKEGNTLNRKPLKRTARKCNEDAEVGSPQLVASGRGTRG